MRQVTQWQWHIDEATAGVFSIYRRFKREVIESRVTSDRILTLSDKNKIRTYGSRLAPCRACGPVAQAG